MVYAIVERQNCRAFTNSSSFSGDKLNTLLGLVVNAMVTQADGFAEREAAKVMIRDARQATTSADTEVTLGADKGYDAAEFIEELHRMKVTPHVAQNKSRRRSAVADEIAASEGYAISQRIRKRVEEAFGWAKTVAGLRKMRHRGLLKVDWQFTLAMAAYNLVRQPKLLAEVVP